MFKKFTMLFAVTMILGACAQTAQKAETPTGDISVAQAADANVTARGSFVGKSDHVTTGHASIGRIGKQWVVILDDDFSFDGAPDPRIAFGRNGKYAKNTDFKMCPKR